MQSDSLKGPTKNYFLLWKVVTTKVLFGNTLVGIKHRDKSADACKNVYSFEMIMLAVYGLGFDA